jgi:hypothetical protein
MTALVALATFLPGSFDSAAAMVTISAPTKAKITVATPENIARAPWGKKPPLA